MSRRSHDAEADGRVWPRWQDWSRVVTDPFGDLPAGWAVCCAPEPLEFVACRCSDREEWGHAGPLGHGISEASSHAGVDVRRQPRVAAHERDQLEGTVRGGTVVLGTVIGPPPPVEPLLGLEAEAGLPVPWVRWSRTSSVPLLAVVTKPPMLGFAMSQVEKGIVMSARTSMSPPRRSAETLKRTVFATPCMSSVPVAS